MTSILGISAFYHDSAAALVIDGKIIAAAQEERFSRKKHDARYPFNAVEYILEESKLNLFFVSKKNLRNNGRYFIRDKNIRPVAISTFQNIFA